MDIFAMVGSLVVGLIAALVTFLVSFRQRMERKKENERQKELSEVLRVSLGKPFQEYFVEYDSPLFGESTADRMKRIIRNSLAQYPSLETRADIEKQVNERVNELKKRIEAIEARFPKEATLEKIASVNDAILATQLEAMSNSIKTIQDNMLTKWDVVKILFTILAALGGIAAIVFGILNLVKT